MKLSELNNEELNIVADEIDKLQFAIKVYINTDYLTMSESEIKAMKALRTLLKKEAFSVRETAVKKVKDESVKDVILPENKAYLTINSDIKIRSSEIARLNIVVLNQVKISRNDPKTCFEIKVLENSMYVIKIINSTHDIEFKALSSELMCKRVIEDLKRAFNDPDQISISFKLLKEEKDILAKEKIKKHNVTDPVMVNVINAEAILKVSGVNDEN